MAKQSGLGDRVYIDGYDIAGDVQTYTIQGGFAVIDMTGIDKYAFERKGGKRSGSISAVTYLNPGDLAFASPLVDTGSHELLRAMSVSDRVVSLFRGQSADAASLVALQGSYDPTLAADGALTIAVGAQSNAYGLDWGDTLTAQTGNGKSTVTGAGAITSRDFTSATAFGAQAYLHVFNFVGTDATVSIQSSSDNGAGDAFSNVTGLVFDAITTGPQAQRKQTTRTLAIERYLRVNVATTGGFTSLTFAVMVNKNLTLTNM